MQISPRLYCIIFSLLFCCSIARAQIHEPVLVLTSDPTGSCADGRQAVNITSTTFFYCAASTWHSTSGGGSGTTQTIYSQNGVISGCGVSWAGNLVFTVSACTYVIAGVQYTSSLTNVTLETADVTDPRIDAIIVNTSGIATYIKGTANPTPSLPTVDPTSQLGLSFVWVAAGATTPTNFTDTDLYLENTEWTCTASANVNCASTTNPYAGTKDIAFTSAVAGNNVTLVKPAAGTENLSTYQNLVVFIRSGATFPNAKSLTLTWLNGATQVGSGITVKDGLFGFSSSITSTYQQLTIPTSSWGTGSSLVTTLKVAVTGGSSAISFRLDNIKLQGGGNTSNISFMNFKQTYSAASVYSPNDVVIYSGASYVAILTNTNILPTNTTYWTKIGVQSAGAGTVTSSGYTSGTPLSAFSSATNITPATSSNVIALFSTCSGTQYLGADGACHNAAAPSAASQGPFYLTDCTPDASGNVFYTVLAFTNWRDAHWEWAKGIAADTYLYCKVIFPHVLPSGTAKIVLPNLSCNDGVDSHTMTFKTGDIIPSTTMNVGAPTFQATQNFTTTATAYAPSTLTFGITSTPVADAEMIVVIDATTASTLLNNVILEPPYLEFQ